MYALGFFDPTVKGEFTNKAQGGIKSPVTNFGAPPTLTRVKKIGAPPTRVTNFTPPLK